jgi:hypothetical protein
MPLNSSVASRTITLAGRTVVFDPKRRSGHLVRHRSLAVASPKLTSALWQPVQANGSPTLRAGSDRPQWVMHPHSSDRISTLSVRIRALCLDAIRAA